MNRQGRHSDSESQKPSIRRAARRTAWVAAAFCLVVIAVMATNLILAIRYDPVNSPHITALRERIYNESDPAIREELTAEIRQLDLRIRRIDLNSRWFLRTGAWLLAVGILVLLISLKHAITPRQNLPRSGEAGETGDTHVITRRAVEIVGVLLVASTVIFSLLPDRDTPRWFTQTTETALEAVEVPELRDIPSDEEILQQWPRFRGVAGQGHVFYDNIPSEWDGTSGRNILWKTSVPLPGENSPVVWDDYLFVTGATADERAVYCYDTGTGEMRWQYAVPSREQSPNVMAETGFAAPTAATDGRRVYAIFATGDLVALDYEGREVWSRALGVPDNQYGHASSLTVWRDLLIVQYDQGYTPEDGVSVIYAFNTVSGESIWTERRPVQGAWSTPAVFDTPEGPQLITTAAPYVISYDPQSGRERWRAHCLGGDVAPSPVYSDGLVYVAQEFSWVSAIATDGRGDVTETHIRWQNQEGLPDTVTPLVADGLLYLTNTYGIISSYDALTGELLWDHEIETEFNASPVLVGDVIYLLDRSGVMHQFAHGREYREIGHAELGEPSNATAAFRDGRIYLRGKNHLYAVEAEQ